MIPIEIIRAHVLPVAVPPPPNVVFPNQGSYAGHHPNINSTRGQSWNVPSRSSSGQPGSGRELSGYSTLTGSGARMPESWPLHGVSARALLGCRIRSARPRQTRTRGACFPGECRGGAEIFVCSQYRAVGTQTYRGLKLSFQRCGSRPEPGGNYTVSHC